MLQMSKPDGSKGKSLLDRCSVRLDKVKAKLWHRQSLTPDARAISGRLEDLPSPKQVFGNPSGLLQSGKLAAHPEDLPEAFEEDTVVPNEAQVELQGPTNDGGESSCVQCNITVMAQHARRCKGPAPVAALAAVSMPQQDRWQQSHR